MAKVKIPSTQPVKVITTESGDGTPEILLYGVIGQRKFYYEESEDDLTDLVVVRSIKGFEAKGHKKLHIRINSVGGSELHGDAIQNAIQTSSMDIHTYNDGVAASKAADIFLAAKKENRHAAKNSKLMLHTPMSYVYGNAEDHRATAEQLDKFAEAGVMQMASDTGLSEDEVRSRFYDHKDHWLTAKDALEIGLISKIEDYNTEDLPDDIHKMEFKDVVKLFEQTNESTPSKFWAKMEKMLSALNPSKATNKPINNQKSITDMNIDEIKKSLTDKNLSLDDLADILKENGMEVTKKEETPPPSSEGNGDLAAIVEKAVKAATEPLQQEISTLKEDVQKLGDEPGAGTTQTASDGDPYEGMNEGEIDATKRTEAFNKKTIEAAENGMNIKIVR